MHGQILYMHECQCLGSIPTIGPFSTEERRCATINATSTRY